MNTILELEREDISKISPFDLIVKAGITKAPVDVFYLAKHIGVTIDTSWDLKKDLSLSGEIYIDAESKKPVIWINPLDYETRQRFTMAHEIAHLVNDIIPAISSNNVASAQFHDSPNSLKRDGRQDPVEFRANEFAAQLLMPIDFIVEEANKIVNDYRKLNGDIAKIPRDDLIVKLAEIFKVSKQAMTIRFNRLVS